MKLFAVFFAFFVLSACTGEMEGLVRKEGARVKFDYEQGPDSLRVTMPDGESFSGKIVYIQSQQQGSSLGLNFGSSSGTFNGEPLSTSRTDISLGMQSLQAFDGTADAVLFGNNGTTMRCKFRIADTSFGLLSGGIGLCVTISPRGDDKIIDVQF